MALCSFLHSAIFSFSIWSLIRPTFPNVHGYLLESFMHQTKPKTSLVQHVEYEPDLLTQAREKRGVKISTNFWTPCTSRRVRPVAVELFIVSNLLTEIMLGLKPYLSAGRGHGFGDCVLCSNTNKGMG